jgi:hypothetical protein
MLVFYENNLSRKKQKSKLSNPDKRQKFDGYLNIYEIKCLNHIFSKINIYNIYMHHIIISNITYSIEC